MFTFQCQLQQNAIKLQQHTMNHGYIWSQLFWGGGGGLRTMVTYGVNCLEYMYLLGITIFYTPNVWLCMSNEHTHSFIWHKSWFWHAYVDWTCFCWMNIHLICILLPYSFDNVKNDSNVHLTFGSLFNMLTLNCKCECWMNKLWIHMHKLIWHVYVICTCGG